LRRGVLELIVIHEVGFAARKRSRNKAEFTILSSLIESWSALLRNVGVTGWRRRCRGIISTWWL
jgi:hypothetical protein